MCRATGEVAMWMDNLKRRKERYYRDNLEVILHIIPGYDKNTLIEPYGYVWTRHL